MVLATRHALAGLGCAASLLLAGVSGLHAERGGPDLCRQGLLALILMIDAEEHDRTHYRSTAKTVVETCGPPAARQAAPAPAAGFDKGLCGKLGLAMLESIEGGKLDSPQFADARDEFAGKCIGADPRR
jgi:hypothetical protein